jgi:hypothetical protein
MSNQIYSKEGVLFQFPWNFPSDIVQPVSGVLAIQNGILTNNVTSATGSNLTLDTTGSDLIDCQKGLMLPTLTGASRTSFNYYEELIINPVYSGCVVTGPVNWIRLVRVGSTVICRFLDFPVATCTSAAPLALTFAAGTFPSRFLPSSILANGICLGLFTGTYKTAAGATAGSQM